MRVRSIIAATAALVVAAAVPAQAYNADAYSYAAGHMITAKQIPSALAVKSNGFFTASSSGDSNWLCGGEDFEVRYPGGKYQYNIGYNGKKDVDNVSVSVEQYASASKAIAAFKKLGEGLDKCAGEQSGTETYDSGTDTWNRLTTVGNVPLVTVTGVVSKFMNQNYTDVTTGEYPSNYTSDYYSVFTLVNDVIITTSYSSGSELNIPTKQRKAVNQTAFNAVSAWLG